MPRSLREQLGFLALLPFLGNASAAEGLPPLQIDPALLGPPPAKKPVEAPAAQQPIAPAATAATPSGTAPANPAIPAAPAEPRAVKPQAAGEAAPAQAQQRPPEVAEAPKVAPTYSAHAAAGLLPTPAQKEGPTTVTADSISGTTDVETVAEGNVEVHRDRSTVNTDRLVYREPIDEVEAIGNVRLRRDKDEMTGPHMKLKLDDSTGIFESPVYTVQHLPLGQVGGKPVHEPVTGHGKAERLDFQGEDRYHMVNATYSTCPVTSADPSWFARVSDLTLDYNEEVATARDAKVLFKGVPVLYSPWLSFSLNNQRTSGFLAPSIGSTSQGGPEFTVPYYWNIAPEMDATVAPRVMTKRGLQLQGEYRYLGANYHGEVDGEYLDHDRIFGKERSALSIQHAQNFGAGFSGSVNLARVSDDTYFKDLSTKMTNVSQTNLLRQGILTYSAGWWTAQAMAQRFQTLQDPSQPPVAIPYGRLPQLTLNATRADLPLDLVFDFRSEYVDFEHPTQVLGKRTTLYPQFSLPLQTAAFYVTPKIGFNTTHYSLERQTAGTPDKLTRSLPIFSVDSGVTFERQTDLFGRDFTQTLEPRLFYLRVPYRDQHLIPVFDTGLADFNFAQIFSENVFTGGDRIADANQLTAAVSSRFIDPASGAELLKGAIGQRYYFSDQNVTLPGVAPRSGHIADFLAAVSGYVAPQTYVDSGLQYNPRDHRLERFNLGGRYQPEPGKLLNASYRYNRTLPSTVVPSTLANQTLNQIDVSGQWPLMSGWSGIGRYNYSIKEKRPIETIGGLEYNADCWIARFVVQRVATAVGRANSSMFVQLELNGFSRIGSNPLNILRRSVPGYGGLSQSGFDSDFPAY